MASPRKTSKRNTSSSKPAAAPSRAKAVKGKDNGKSAPTGARSAKPGKSARSARPGKSAKSPAGAPPAGATDAEHPTVALVRGLADVVAATALTELVVELPDAKLTLRREPTAQALSAPPPVAPVASLAPAAAIPPAVQHLPPPTAPVESPAQVAAVAPPPVDDDAHTVTSPFVGTFYRRPNPDTDPYVEIGARIEKGHVLCIIEAMKLMNEIESDVAGVVVAVLVDDSEPVEYGQPLFKIRTR